MTSVEVKTPAGKTDGTVELPAEIFDVQANSAGTSRMFQVRGPMMVKGRYDDVTMKNEVWQKDMKIIGDYARSLGVAEADASFDVEGWDSAAKAAAFIFAATRATHCRAIGRVAGVDRD